MFEAKPIRTESWITRRPALPRLFRCTARLCATIACAVFAINLLAIAAILGERALSDATRSVDKRAALPNYREFDWATTHFREFAELSSVHHSYYGWRRRPYQGLTINIDDQGVRRTYTNPEIEPTKTIAFFGGSTTWGSGSDDDHTIPSMFAKMRSEYRAYNFGETAHTAHQNLNYLIKVLADGFLPDVVVFYNGSSEINKCRVELEPFSKLDESRIRAFLDDEGRGLQGAEAVLSMVQPAMTFARKLQRSVAARLYGAGDRRDCAGDPEKASMIARTLLWDWLTAKRLVEGYGGRFIAALQPVAYFGNPRKDHIAIDPELERQYRAVYGQYDPLLQNDFPELEGNFLDLRDAFDRDAYIYIDADHVSPSGSKIIAARISAYLQ